VDGTGRIVVLVEVVVEVAVEACGNQRDHTVEAVTTGTGEPRVPTVLDKEGTVFHTSGAADIRTNRTNHEECKEDHP
jgi:hypothetical protein